MSTSLRKIWKTSLVVASTLTIAAVSGCGDDDDAAGGAGHGGMSSDTAGKSAGGKSAGKAGAATGGVATGGNATGKAGNSNAGKGGSANEAGDTSVGGSLGAGGATGGDDGGGAAGEAGTPGAGGVGNAASCEEYCDWVQTGCAAAADTQYPSKDQCLRSCAAFPRGDAANSLSCRSEQAALVADDASHCDAAGPAGVGVCGSPCQAFCNLMTTYCPNEAEGASLAACLAECATVPGNDLTTFVYPSAGGDTLACRIAHATNAAADPDPNGDARLLHCNHAAGDPGPCLDGTP